MEDHQHLNHLLHPSTACSTPAPPTQTATPPAQLAAPPVQPDLVPQFNWSDFKLEFIGKPNEDAEAHLLGQTIGWTLIHFQRVSKSKDFVYHL